MAAADEETRAALFLAQCARREAAAAGRCARLAGNAAARAALTEAWRAVSPDSYAAPLLGAGVE